MIYILRILSEHHIYIFPSILNFYSSSFEQGTSCLEMLDFKSVLYIAYICLQTRSKLNTYGGGMPAEVTAGGNALKFYSSVRLHIRRKQQLKRGDVVIFISTM